MKRDIKIKINYIDDDKISRCEKCGSNIIADTTFTLMSNPPQYNAKCSKCDWVGYIGVCDYNEIGFVEEYVTLEKLSDMIISTINDRNIEKK